MNHVGNKGTIGKCSNLATPKTVSVPTTSRDMRLHHKHNLSMRPHMRNCCDFVFSTRFMGWHQKSNSLLISCTALAVLGKGCVFLFVVLPKHVLRRNKGPTFLVHHCHPRTILQTKRCVHERLFAKWNQGNSTMDFFTTHRC